MKSLYKTPERYQRIKKRHPQIVAAHDNLSSECARSGPLDGRTCELIKLAIASGAAVECAVKSHTRRALEAGASEDEIIQTILLGTTTIGFPKTMMALSWAQQVLQDVLR